MVDYRRRHIDRRDFLVIEQDEGTALAEALKKMVFDDVVLMDEDTPEYYNLWLKHEANQHGHDGQKYSPFESVLDAVKSVEDWAGQNIEVKACAPKGPMSYGKRREDFILKMYQERWSNITEHKEIRVLY